ncbi:MAG: DNA polymerase III subunit delta [Planctomycetota bacterium]
MEKKIPPVIILEGEEKFLKDEEISSIYKAFEKTFPCVDTFEFEGNKVSLAIVLDEVRTFSLFQGAKIVIVRDAESLLQENGDIFKQYLESPVKSACLVIDVKKLDGRTSFAKTVKAAKIVKSFTSFSEKDATSWLIQRAELLYHKKLNLDNARLILEFVGSDLSLLSSELEKVVSLSHDNVIKREEIESIVVRGRARDLFALSNAVERKNSKVAITILMEILTQGALQRDSKIERDINRIQEQIINTLRWVLGRFIRANFMISKGTTREETAKRLGIHSYYTGNFLESLSRFSETECSRCHGEILSADLSLKSEDKDTESVLTKLVLSLCR